VQIVEKKAQLSGMKNQAKFRILPSKGPNQKKRIVLVGGNGEPIATTEGYRGGTAAAKHAIEALKRAARDAEIELPKPKRPSKKAK
jgi:uncharacterized protein YegP (UPF0339 family)